MKPTRVRKQGCMVIDANKPNILSAVCLRTSVEILRSGVHTYRSKFSTFPFIIWNDGASPQPWWKRGVCRWAAVSNKKMQQRYVRSLTRVLTIIHSTVRWSGWIQWQWACFDFLEGWENHPNIIKGEPVRLLFGSDWQGCFFSSYDNQVHDVVLLSRSWLWG